MKRLLVLFALISFTIGLNATVTQEDIYKTNPQMFDQLKKELSLLKENQTKELKKAYINQQVNDAVKLLLSNKQILKYANYAVIRNGKILKTGNAKDADGLSFWHLHRDTLQDPPAENTCVITNPSWDNTGWTAINNTCGLLAFQLMSESSYTNLTVPNLYFLPDMADTTVIDNLYPDTLYNTDQSGLEDLKNLSIHYYHDTVAPEREIPFRNHEIVSDVVPDIVVVSQQGYINKNTHPPLSTSNWDRFYSFYRPTVIFLTSRTKEQTENADIDILTLKSGYYIPLLQTGEFVNDAYWWEGYTVILKWFRLKVENYYLGDVAVENHNQESLANIVWNNRQIKIDLANSVNLANTTYELYDISGRLLHRENLSAHQTTHDIPALTPSGVYVIRVKGTNLSLSKKIVFKK